MLYCIVCYLMAICVSSITAGCRGWCFSVAMARLGIRIRNFLFGAVIDQEIGFFDTVKTGMNIEYAGSILIESRVQTYIQLLVEGIILFLV